MRIDEAAASPATGQGLLLHEVVAATGERVRTIHYWVQQELLPGPVPPGGTGARYAPDTLLRVRAIRSLQSRGQRLDAIRATLRDRDPAEVLRDLERDRAPASPPAAAPLPAGLPSAPPIARNVRVTVEDGIVLEVSEHAHRLGLAADADLADLASRLAAALDAARRALAHPAPGKESLP